VGFLATAAGTIGSIGLGTLGYSLIEAQAFTTRNVQCRVLPKGSSDLRVLHLSDLHITPAQTRKINWVRSLGELEPDLVVVTGDFLAHKLAVPAVIEALGSLLDRPGLFVLGSNDYFAPVIKSPLMYFDRDRKIKAEGVALPTQDLVDELSNYGWLDLDNKQERLIVNDLKIHARGTDDPHINKDQYELVAGTYDTDAFALGVTHAPYTRVLKQFAIDKTDLILAGHTHGGQICVPFYGALVTNCDLPTGQAKGLSEFISDDRATPLHVSAGVGTSPFTPIRLACRPEATLLTLSAKNS
jgi:predicted MPP superfamily phosphohydrolase